MSRHCLSVRGTEMFLDERPFLIKGLRCSNALVSESAVDELIANLEAFAAYGVNTISVYWMGSRFGDVWGYREDATLDPTYAARFKRIIEAADARSMVVLVGGLYWGDSRSRWASWTQQDANEAMRRTAHWLREHDYRNVFVDVDNEGMARREKGFDNRELVRAIKAVDPGCLVATNFRGAPPPEIDLAIHHSNPAPDKPYVETEGSPREGIPGGQGYWGPYSNPRDGSYNYAHIGVYTPEMQENQKALTREHLDSGRGYMLASTWLQAPPPSGPNHRPGGDGSAQDPGIRWWLAFLRESCGSYLP